LGVQVPSPLLERGSPVCDGAKHEEISFPIKMSQPMGPHGSRTSVMGKEKTATSESGIGQFVHELLNAEIYKRSQGRIVRQFTCLAIWVAFALAAWQMHVYMLAIWPHMPMAAKYAISFSILVIGIWLGYRIVNLPSFADFLIAVEAEMNKVSWPSRTELVRSSMVVIILMFGLTMVLFFYDTLLTWLLSRVLNVTII
jgi:preprotein translocase subunit SecE